MFGKSQFKFNCDNSIMIWKALNKILKKIQENVCDKVLDQLTNIFSFQPLTVVAKLSNVNVCWGPDHNWGIFYQNWRTNK